MDNRAFPDIESDIAAALDWWREAGVDYDFSDAPVSWASPEEALVPVQQEKPGPAKKPTAVETAPVDHQPAARDKSEWPSDAAGFVQWWLNEPWLDGGQTRGRVPPRGVATAKLMIVVPEPEGNDSETLLSGPQGKLLDAMLSAFGCSMNDAYIASVLPRRTPAPDWQEIAARGLGDVLLHHVGLVAPERLLVFGSNILPFFGNDLPQGSASLRSFNHEGTSIPLLAARSLEALLERPRWKAGLWHAWLDWTRDGQAV